MSKKLIEEYLKFVGLAREVGADFKVIKDFIKKDRRAIGLRLIEDGSTQLAISREIVDYLIESKIKGS